MRYAALPLKYTGEDWIEMEQAISRNSHIPGAPPSTADRMSQTSLFQRNPEHGLKIINEISHPGPAPIATHSIPRQPHEK
jgi:hypothetical protein